jgi:TonB family protein
VTTPPESFGRYEVLAEIGDGAMGRVYSAWDPAVSRVVAIKTIKAEYLTRDTAPEYMKRFRREAQAAGGLNHPCVVRVYDVGENFLVMEYVEGKTLQVLIREQGHIDPAETLRLLGPVAEAIDHAHASGIVHRDIKPANIIVQTDGRPKLMDFGVAHVETSVMTTAGQILGSPTYMAPEQIAGGEVSGGCDVYSLSVVAYEMLTGQPPFQGATITQVIYQVMHDSAPPPRRWNADLPERYDEVFARALAKDPSRRFATATEFVAALDIKELEHALDVGDEGAESRQKAKREAEDHPTVLSTPPGPASRAPGSRHRVALLGLAAAVVLVAGWLWLGRSSPSAETPVALPAADASPVVEPPSDSVPTPEPSPSETPTPEPSARVPDRPATPKPPAVGELVELGPGVTPPQRIEGTTAPYPDRARQLRLYGTVTVSMIIDETGTPVDPEVVESAGPILDQAVLDAVRAWRFQPATKDGVPVKVRWTVKQTYQSAR